MDGPTASKRASVLARQLRAAAGGESAVAAGCAAGDEVEKEGDVVVHIDWKARGERVNPALREERDAGTFNTRHMTYLLDGSEKMTHNKELVMKQLESDPVFRIDDREDLDLPAVRERTMEKVRAVWRLFVSDAGDEAMRDARVEITTLYDPHWATRNGVHYGLWMGAIQGQGDVEQQDEWLPPTMFMQLFGCFCMTELGHGSFIRGFETTSTYDRDTEEFVVHTPTLTATKWWIGGAAQTATHGVVFARLIVGDTDYGVHSFVVQLRSMEDHTVLPGIKIGDIGKKMGRDGVDNGWIQFDHVRIPRRNMLMRYSQVAADGTFTRTAKAQMAYGALIGARGTMIKDSADVLKVAVTTMVRYGSVRRQGEPFRPGQKEPKIIDYRAFQRSIMPLLASAYALNFVSTSMKRQQKLLEAGLEADDASALPDVHATSSGLKAFCTWITHEGLETCRQRLGGHGYSAYTRLSTLSADFAVMCTWEGDNTVMAQQTSRYLVKCYHAATRGEELQGSVTYLQEFAADGQRWTATRTEDVQDMPTLLTAMRFVACKRVQDAARRLESLRSKGFTQREAWNECQDELIDASRAHCYYFMAKTFAEEINRAPVTNAAYSRLQPVLRQLAALFALSHLQTCLGFLLVNNFMQPDQARLVERALRSLCRQVRQQAVPLVDAFNYSDFVLGSPLARYDGDVYTHYFRRVRSVPGSRDRAPYYKTIQKQFANEM